MKLQTLIYAAFALMTFPSFAVVTKNCPSQLSVQFDQPQIEKWYAIKAYETYFSENTVEGEFYLAGTGGSECSYRRIEGTESPIYQIVLKGTFRNGKNPTMVSYMNLPIRGETSNGIGGAIAYSDIAELKPEGIVLKGKTSLYYASEYCSYGDCIPDYIYLGHFGLVEVR